MQLLTRSDGVPRTFAARAVTPDDEWSEALTKLFPTEVFSAYLGAVALMTAVDKTPTWFIAAWCLFGAGVLATVIYMIATWDPDPDVLREEMRFAWPQLILAVVAFSTWAFTIGGAFTAFTWYEQWLGGIALIMGSLLLTGLNKLIGSLAG